jgi:hypothetical protein
MIFIVHATITEEAASKKSTDLNEIFKSFLPSCALRQMGEFMQLITDRISQVPSVWLMVLTPLIVWLSLHRDDELASTLFVQ